MLRKIVFVTLLGAASSLAAQPAEKPRSDVDKVIDGAGEAVEQPLKDLNIVKEKVPPDLEAIMERPYDLGGKTSCAQLKAEIARMTASLGPDVDAVKPTKDKTATDMVVDGAQSLAGGLIPGQGLLRKVSGAEAAQKKKAAAILAGSLRRAYAKGLAKGKGCKV